MCSSDKNIVYPIGQSNTSNLSLNPKATIFVPYKNTLLPNFLDNLNNKHYPIPNNVAMDSEKYSLIENQSSLLDIGLSMEPVGSVLLSKLNPNTIPYVTVEGGRPGAEKYITLSTNSILNPHAINFVPKHSLEKQDGKLSSCVESSPISIYQSENSMNSTLDTSSRSDLILNFVLICSPPIISGVSTPVVSETSDSFLSNDLNDSMFNVCLQFLTPTLSELNDSEIYKGSIKVHFKSSGTDCKFRCDFRNFERFSTIFH